ncbi:MAG: FixH family protein [Sphingobacteriaceae bacterium]|nr:FixH family protein [Sphingobacteriaceae bacterium]
MNWGTKIIAGMVCFMLFIVAMVVYMFKVHDQDALVEDDYYEKGLSYDQEYDAKQNVIDDKFAPIISINEHQIVIQLKQSASYTATLMRPSDAKADQKSSGKTIGDANLILIPRSNMGKGLWSLSLNWESNSKKYLFKKDITL